MRAETVLLGASGSLDEVADQLLGFMTQARWFAGKGRRLRLRSLTPLPWLTGVEEWPAVRMEVVEVEYPADEDADEVSDETSWPRELYGLPISYRRAPIGELHFAEIGRWSVADLGAVVAYDAPQDPAAAAVLLRQLLDGAVRRDHDAEVRFHRRDTGVLAEGLAPSVFGGQQSNTSISYGDLAMLKLFRRLELGHNLDIEVHEALSGLGDLAELYGWVEARWPYEGDLVSADLAMAVEKLAEAEEGWELALDSLRDGRDFTTEAAALGQALAETHQALRSAFPTARQPGSAVAAVMKQRLAAAAEIAPALAPVVDGLSACFDALGAEDVATQRVHGDFHLGQTLRTPGGWKLIDFEGEPAKTLAERAAPDTVWRDVAGMLRSFDYAAASVPGPASAEWEIACRAAFLAGYAEGPLDPGDAAVLRAYEADKAVYEVVYETRNRPDWIGIPLAAAQRIAGADPSTRTE